MQALALCFTVTHKSQHLIEHGSRQVIYDLLSANKELQPTFETLQKLNPKDVGNYERFMRGLFRIQVLSWFPCNCAKHDVFTNAPLLAVQIASLILRGGVQIAAFASPVDYWRCPVWRVQQSPVR